MKVGGQPMEIVYRCCCGIDVHKKMIGCYARDYSAENANVQAGHRSRQSPNKKQTNSHEFILFIRERLFL